MAFRPVIYSQGVYIYIYARRDASVIVIRTHARTPRTRTTAASLTDAMADGGGAMEDNLNEGPEEEVESEQKSKYYGVRPAPRKKYMSWRAQILVDGKGIYIGSFKSEIEAALAYDERARQLGRRTNFENSSQRKCFRCDELAVPNTERCHKHALEGQAVVPAGHQHGSADWEAEMLSMAARVLGEQP